MRYQIYERDGDANTHFSAEVLVGETVQWIFGEDRLRWLEKGRFLGETIDLQDPKSWRILARAMYNGSRLWIVEQGTDIASPEALARQEAQE